MKSKLSNVKVIKLEDNQKEILEEFIKTFLPKRGNKRKNSGNEIEYITSSLDKVFKQNFGFNLTRQNILDKFEELNYDIFTRKGVWDAENKIDKPSKDGDLVRYGDGYSGYNASYIYIDIEAPILRQLMRTTFSSFPDIGINKLKETEEMKKKLQNFKLSVQHKF